MAAKAKMLDSQKFLLKLLVVCLEPRTSKNPNIPNPSI